MGNTGCSDPSTFTVDLTPPTCGQPVLRSGGDEAGAFFAVPDGLAVQWSCADVETSMSYVEFEIYDSSLDVPVSPSARRPGGSGIGSTSFVGRDGNTYYACVQGFNAVSLPSARVCSSAPVLSASSVSFHLGLEM